ncbi:hypothetical protein G6F50_015107 [Rhizopus delemar]|uniref:Uncharacterized protein n=1 Tax=Rhizopus delemar TaxID=936053 RepID=A0A9P6XZY3_9FUNG|nr:hypothetical protein G6F50_015107 [Rhizopus delemar]
MKDLTPVASVAVAPVAIVATKALPVKDFAGLVEYARAHPEGVRYGTPGQGTVAHIGMAAVTTQTNTKMLHVPYRGNSQALTVGADLWRHESGSSAGVMLSSGNATSTSTNELTGYYARGKVKGEALGIYGTWRGGNGAVFDPALEQQGRIALDVDTVPLVLRWASLATDAGPGGHRAGGRRGVGQVHHHCDADARHRRHS